MSHVHRRDPVRDESRVDDRRVPIALSVRTSTRSDQMPYTSVSELPKAQTDQYTPHQKEAFLKAFNSAFKEYGGDESRAFAVAHSAAKRASESGGAKEH
jgi:cation transport regulator